MVLEPGSCDRRNFPLLIQARPFDLLPLSAALFYLVFTLISSIVSHSGIIRPLTSHGNRF